GEPIDQLWQRIKRHFAGDQKAEKAMTEVETQQSETALTKLEVLADIAGQNGEPPLISGKQELYENIINQHL
ncbi:MAG: hypothetical protein F6K42_35840, partial [Leptolyngbya sp. SIO1D8]|nr:hypothetical protein [Leptolyngbya sp. SIO1D8]